MESIISIFVTFRMSKSSIFAGAEALTLATRHPNGGFARVRGSFRQIEAKDVAFFAKRR